MLEMGKKRRQFKPEFKAEIVRLVLEGGQAVPQVCAEHELNPATVYGWVRQAKVDLGQGPEGAWTTEEREELSRLRKELKEVKRERDFLQSAAAYFAKVKK